MPKLNTTEDTLSECMRGIQAMGFEEMAVSALPHSRDRFYKHARSTSAVEYFAALSYKPKARVFGLSLGASSPAAMALLRQNLATLLKYLHPSVRESGLLQRPCWTMFSAGRALNWDYMAIPAPRDPSSWPAQLRDVTTKLLEPVFFSITRPEGIFDLLIRDDDPLVWWAASSAVLRAAEIIALSRVAGIDITTVREKLTPFADNLARNMGGAKTPDSMINEFAHVLRASH